MASARVVVPWWERTPGLIQEIEADLRDGYPTLRLALSHGKAEVKGTYPVKGEHGSVLDRWAVSIVLPPEYPVALPIVREVGGRIKPDLDNHVLDEDGTACVLLPETRYRSFPIGARFRVYLDGPLRAFFASQSFRARGGSWVHGEWEHGSLAAVRFYKELLGSTDDVVGWRALIAMAIGLQDEQTCPCGAGRPVQHCHPELLEVRDNLAPAIPVFRLVTALCQKFGIENQEEARRYIDAIRRRPKGHHPCPCGSGARIRDCHPKLRDLRDAWPLPRKTRSRRRR